MSKVKAYAARMPPDLLEKVEADARTQHRSVTQVLNLRLAHSYATCQDLSTAIRVTHAAHQIVGAGK